jgi:hypothetical protein
MPFDVRQNTTAPCILEKTDDGDTWVQFADLALCSPSLPPVVSGGEVFVQYEGELIPISQLPPDVDTVTTSDQRRPEGADGDEARCLAAVNAAYVFRRLHEESWKFAPFTQLPGNLLASSAIALIGLGIIAAPAIPLAAASALIAFLFIGNANQFTSAVERQFACILKNRSYISGGEVYFDFSLVRADAAANIVGINIWSFIAAYLDIIQANGLNLAGTTTAITCCSDPCSSATDSYIIDLRLEQNKDYLVAGTLFSSTMTWTAGQGWRLQGTPTSTAQGSFYTTLSIRPGSWVTNIFFRVVRSHEPYNWSLQINGQLLRTQSGYRPFGNWWHGLSTPLNQRVTNLNAYMYAHFNAVNNSAADITDIRIDYYGCPPL